jgi:hypothetical protein
MTIAAIYGWKSTSQEKATEEARSTTRQVEVAEPLRTLTNRRDPRAQSPTGRPGRTPRSAQFQRGTRDTRPRGSVRV